MKTFFRDLLGMLVLAVCLLSAAQAQGVPGAIKYQAVLRDVNGKTLVNKNDVNLRISLRLDDPVLGTIAYSEVHEGVSTNAYGVIHLEIGRGEVTSGTTLNAIAWGEHKVYVQVEIETDGTGYTHMGNSELLTVPYAFYAENASGKNLYEHLKDNFIPKYNESNKTLVNSGLSQKDRALEVDASSITFVDRSTGKPGYTFPMEAGRTGQVLRLADNQGTLKWDTAGGGGSIGGGNVDFGFGPLDDGRMVYWNDPLGKLQTAPFVYNYNSSTKNFSLTGDMSVTGNMTVEKDMAVKGEAMVDKNMTVGQDMAVKGEATVDKNMTVGQDMAVKGEATVDKNMTVGQNVTVSGDAMVKGKIAAKDSVLSETAIFVGTVGGTPVFSAANSGVLINKSVLGTNNLLTSNALGDGQIWIGDNNSMLSSSLTPHSLSGHVLMDKEGKTKLNLELKGLTLIPATDRDILCAESDSLWRRNAADNIYAYNQGKALEQTFVGIGTDAPGAMLHVEGGEVRFTGVKNTDGNTPLFYWDPLKSSLVAGAVSDMGTLGSQGEYSISLGLDALATTDNGLAFGKEANVQGEDAVAIGVQSSAGANQSIAFGREATVNGDKGVAIGYLTKVNASNSVVLGGSSTAKSNSVVIGYNNGTDPSVIDESIVIGKNNGTANGSIVLGSGNLNADNSILIGRDISKQQKNAIILGGIDYPLSDPSKTCMGYSFIPGKANNLVVMGSGNEYTTENDSYSPDVNMFGSNLVINNPKANITMIGDGYTYENIKDIVDPLEYPVFAYGSYAIGETGQANSVAFAISDYGNAYFLGDVKANGSMLNSDMRLKTDIKPMFFAPTLLDSLQPVSFVFKSDKKRQTRFGFIAQEVREIFPELVRENAKGMLSMDYIGLVPVLWQINQQLSHKVNELEEQLKEQSRRQIELENELEAIKAKLGM